MKGEIFNYSDYFLRVWLQTVQVKKLMFMGWEEGELFPGRDMTSQFIIYR
jgi:hypothetical protein